VTEGGVGVLAPALQLSTRSGPLAGKVALVTGALHTRARAAATAPWSFYRRVSIAHGELQAGDDKVAALAEPRPIPQKNFATALV
jgi:hypothetical protein